MRARVIRVPRPSPEPWPRRIRRPGFCTSAPAAARWGGLAHGGAAPAAHTTARIGNRRSRLAAPYILLCQEVALCTTGFQTGYGPVTCRSSTTGRRNSKRRRLYSSGCPNTCRPSCLNVYIRERHNCASCPWVDVPHCASSAMFKLAVLISALVCRSRLGYPQESRIAMIAEYT